MTKLSVTDQTNLLTGRDELRIEEKFGAEIDQLGFTKGLRALVFVALVREGKSEAMAYEAVMDMTQAQVADQFLTDDADPDAPADGEGGEPASAEGNGEQHGEHHGG